jgi:hypothetical protein
MKYILIDDQRKRSPENIDKISKLLLELHQNDQELFRIG